jgi:CDP-paratose 2-epimerase
MAIVIITGSGGLVGADAVRHYASAGYTVVGIDNDMRREFFGEEASTQWQSDQLKEEFPAYRHYEVDIRDSAAVEAVFSEFGADIELVIHAAAQPSHDWAASDPETDFTVNANGTSVMLESARGTCPGATFIFMSTNKVYGDTPNRLPLVEQETRWELDETHRYARDGIDESMSIDQTKHSLFGASKVAADVLVQEYGRYFGMKTGVFRGGCLTGPGHSGARLHGFLSYLMMCAMMDREYTIHGYKGKQVRDNIHSKDLIAAFEMFHAAPRCGEVYNIGGSRFSNCSMLEAIEACEAICGKSMNTVYSNENRIGDHIWWISSVGKLKSHYPDWKLTYDVSSILTEIHDALRDRQLTRTI